MTSQEYRAAIAALGLSQAKAAKVLGIHLRTSQAYAGGRPIPKAIELALVGLLAKAKAEGWNRIDEYGATYIEAPDGSWTRV